jgi:hypothetical protein
VTKQCGAFYQFFPNAADAGIQATCTSNACFLSKPGAFKISPYHKVQCSKRTWQYQFEEIEEDPIWEGLTFEEYE